MLFKQCITMYCELHMFYDCKNIFDTVIIVCFCHDINNALKYCPTQVDVFSGGNICAYSV